MNEEEREEEIRQLEQEIANIDCYQVPIDRFDLDLWVERMDGTEESEIQIRERIKSCIAGICQNARTISRLETILADLKRGMTATRPLATGASSENDGRKR